MKVLSLPHLAQRLNERFKILTGGSRSAVPRQKTLGALIDWSYDLLSPQEQTLFTRAAIFAGGFSLDAATAVCAGEGVDEIVILDLLSSLTDKSLVVADTGGEQERYRLLESTRAYAFEKLAAAGERDRLARRHGEYFRDEAQAADIRYGTGSTAAWLARVELELDNYRAMLEWAFTNGHDVALGGAVAGALERLWLEGGLTAEGRYWIGRAQAGLDESEQPQVAARLWRALALLSDGKRGHNCAERAHALYQSLGDGHGAARALKELGYCLTQMGRLEEASGATARALAVLRECGDKWGVARCLVQQANIHGLLGDVAAGRDLYSQALDAVKALSDEAGIAFVLANLAELEFADGHVEQALHLVDEALEIHARGKNATNLAFCYVNSAAYCIALGDVDGAREAAREALRWAQQAQYALGIAWALQHFALLAARRGQAHNAARLMGYVNVHYKEVGSEPEYTEKWGYEKLMAALREHLSEADIEKLAAEGAAWSEDQAVEEALKV